MASFGDILKVVASMSIGVGVTVQNVYHVIVAEVGGVDDGDIPDDMGEWLEDIYTEINPHIPNDLVYEEYSLQNVTVDLDLGTHGFPSMTIGGSSSEFLPTQVAPLVRVRTDVPGVEGRKFFPTFVEANTTNGQFSPTAVNNMLDAGQVAYAPWVATSGNNYQGTVYNREFGIARPPTEIIATSNPATQRRRRVGRGI